MKNIVLITSGQPSTNPRLVKEADSLAEAGYDVLVIYQYWTYWATQADKELLKGKKWKYMEAGGNPDKKLVFLLTKVLHKIFRFLYETCSIKSAGVAESAICRSYYFLKSEVFKHKADLYIAHNLGALPIAIKAAKRAGALSGFDAEDFHRYEGSDNPLDKDVVLKKYIEDKYIPLADYKTTASPLISVEYQNLYKGKPLTSILNVFPKQNISRPEINKDVLELFWFSQTIGKGRGIEEVIAGIAKVHKEKIHLHLLGDCNEPVKEYFRSLAAEHLLPPGGIKFHAPVKPEEIFRIAAQFDIGLAAETGIPYNRDICLTNKIFTYIQSGLAVIASDTKAQRNFLANYPASGKIYAKGNVEELANAIKLYFDDPSLLNKTRIINYTIGQDELNWEQEEKKFLRIVKQSLERV